MPWTLAKLYPTTVTVLSDRAFFWPLWSDDHIHAVYGSTGYDFESSGQLACVSRRCVQLLVLTSQISCLGKRGQAIPTGLGPIDNYYYRHIFHSYGAAISRARRTRALDRLGDVGRCRQWCRAWQGRGRVRTGRSRRRSLEVRQRPHPVMGHRFGFCIYIFVSVTHNVSIYAQ